MALVVNFYPPDGSKVVPSLVMSPAAEKSVMLLIMIVIIQHGMVFLESCHTLRFQCGGMGMGMVHVLWTMFQQLGNTWMR